MWRIKPANGFEGTVLNIAQVRTVTSKEMLSVHGLLEKSQCGQVCVLIILMLS